MRVALGRAIKSSSSKALEQPASAFPRDVASWSSLASCSTTRLIVSRLGALKDHEDCTTIRFVAKVRGLLDLDWEDVEIPLASDATSQVRPSQIAQRTREFILRSPRPTALRYPALIER
jgi:hypothetical protein